MDMSRSESGYGKGDSSTPSTSVKTAVVAPMPSASVSTAMLVKPMLRSSPRAAKRRSFPTPVMLIVWLPCIDGEGANRRVQHLGRHQARFGLRLNPCACNHARLVTSLLEPTLLVANDVEPLQQT